MSKRKGSRNEKKALDKLRDDGYTAERDSSGRYATDTFDLVDIIAVKPGEPVRFIQVKSNKASGKNSYEERALDILPLGHCTFELWVWHDYQGWRIFKLRKDGFEKVRDDR